MYALLHVVVVRIALPDSEQPRHAATFVFSPPPLCQHTVIRTHLNILAASDLSET